MRRFWDLLVVVTSQVGLPATVVVTWIGLKW